MEFKFLKYTFLFRFNLNSKMSIFQLLATQSVTIQHPSISLISSQWLTFKTLTHKFIDNPSLQLEGKLEDHWRSIKSYNNSEIIGKFPQQQNDPDNIDMISEYFTYCVCNRLRSLCQINEGVNQRNQKDIFCQILNKLAQLIEPSFKYLHYINNRQQKLKVADQMKSQIEALGFNCIFQSLFKSSFYSHCNKILTEDIIDLEDKMRQYLKKEILQNAQTNLLAPLDLRQFRDILNKLSKIQLQQPFLQLAFNFLNQDLNSFIEYYIDPSENNQFHRQCLNYQRTFQKAYLRTIESSKAIQKLQSYINKMDNSTYFLCMKSCCAYILDIILDYPDSYPTIASLKHCLQHYVPNLTFSPLEELSYYLHGQITARLLLPGILTQNILNQYINILKVLQQLDPHGIIFDQITLPIKQYLLLSRTDTLRCIISFMTDDVENYSKLINQRIKIPSKQYIEEDNNSENEGQDGWGIIDLGANKQKVRVKYQESDLVTVLVGLYGSQQAFLGEYQNMLAEKLMSAKDYNIEEQIKNIELLKKRFGENALQTCNIIVKDVKDSKRLDKQIHKFKSKHQNANKVSISLEKFNCLAVSKGYWPINYQSSSTNTIPQIFKRIFDEYGEQFSLKKSMRKIQYHYNLGHVNLTLNFKNGDFDFKCMPIHAMMITCFDEDHIRDKNMGVSSQELANWLAVSQNIIKQKMSFWIHKGVIKQQRLPRAGLSLKRITSFQDGQLVYYKPVEQYQQVVSDEIDDDIDNLILKESTTTESNLKHIIEGLIISILSINGPKSPQKIHLLLKTIYKTDLDYTYGENQTLQILKKMVQKKKISYNGETYLLKSD